MLPTTDKAVWQEDCFAPETGHHRQMPELADQGQQLSFGHLNEGQLCTDSVL